MVERRLAKQYANDPYARFLRPGLDFNPPNSTCELVATGFIRPEMRAASRDRVSRYFAQKHDEAAKELLGKWDRENNPIDVEAALAPKRPKPGGSGRVR